MVSVLGQRKVLGAPLPRFALALVVAATLLSPMALPACSPRKPPGTGPGGHGGDPGKGQPPAEYTLRVITDPPGAKVLVDGKESGTTPVDALVQDNVKHTVRVVSGDRAFEQQLDHVAVPLCVIYLRVAADVPGFAAHDISSAQPHPSVTPGPRPIRLVMAATNAPRGPVPMPASLAAPKLTWPESHRAVVAGDVSSIFAGPQGQLALITEHDRDETIFFATADPTHGTVTAKPLLTWRIKAAAQGVIDVFYERLFPVGWAGKHLLFVAPEARSDGDAPGLPGMALWQVDTISGEKHRLSWWHCWATGLRLQGAWLTSDGRAAVIHTFNRGGSHFRVVDLLSRDDRLFSATVPYSEPGGCDLAVVSPDGWYVAWSGSTLAPGPGEVVVLDLRTGKETVVLRSTDGTLGGVQWSPDGRMLAIGYAGKEERHWKVHTDDTGSLFPPRFTVVSLTGQRIAEVAVSGEILGSSLAWSPESDWVSVATIEPVPGTESEDPHFYGSAHHRKVYAGPLGEPLLLVWDPAATGEEQAPAYHEFAFLGDHGLVMSTHFSDRPSRVLLLDLASSGAQGDALAGFGMPTLYDTEKGGYALCPREAVAVASGTVCSY